MYMQAKCRSGGYMFCWYQLAVDIAEFVWKHSVCEGVTLACTVHDLTCSLVTTDIAFYSLHHILLFTFYRWILILQFYSFSDMILRFFTDTIVNILHKWKAADLLLFLIHTHCFSPDNTHKVYLCVLFYTLKPLKHICNCNHSAISMTNYPDEITHKLSTSIFATVKPCPFSYFC